MKSAISLLAALALSFSAFPGGASEQSVIDAASAKTTQPAPVAYRKKVTATRFHVVNSLQVEDIADIWDAYPLELLRRLDLLGAVLPANRISSLPLGGREANPDSLASREVVRRIAELDGSQFVISGVILDAGADSDGVRRADRAWPLPNLKPEPSERRLEVEIFLHDGLTGALILRHRDSALASGMVRVGRDKAFAGTAFLNTSFGLVVAQMLNNQVETIARELERQPWAANIVRIEGKKIFLDAGATSALTPGSRLTVYRKNPSVPVNILAGQGAPYLPETYAATLTLLQVQPNFAIGELAADPIRLNLQVGDLARMEAPVPRMPAPSRSGGG